MIVIARNPCNAGGGAGVQKNITPDFYQQSDLKREFLSALLSRLKKMYFNGLSGTEGVSRSELYVIEIVVFFVFFAMLAW